MLGIGQKFPEFKVKATINTDISTAFTDIHHATYAGKWLVVFFWPKDFTFVCPTEIINFSKKAKDFRKLNCEVLGCSVDSHFSHMAWDQTP